MFTNKVAEAWEFLEVQWSPAWPIDGKPKGYMITLVKFSPSGLRGVRSQNVAKEQT